MTKVVAISNFADGSRKQGDQFEINDDAELERLVAVEAVSVVDESADPGKTDEEDAPAAPPAPEEPANPDPLDEPNPPEQPPASPSKQPTQAEVDKTLASLNDPKPPSDNTPAK